MLEWLIQTTSGSDGDWLLLVRQTMDSFGTFGRTWIGFLGERAIEVLVPTWGEVNVTLATAVLLLLLVGFLQSSVVDEDQSENEDSMSGSRKSITSGQFDGDGKFSEAPVNASTGGENEKEVAGQGWTSPFVYVIRLELLAAKNLVAANLNGTSDPYAIITCGDRKRFSSMVQGSRNPMWGEEFDFYAENLPAEINVSIYDWDIVWKSSCLGSMTLLIDREGQTEPVWHFLNSPSGQVCLQTLTKRFPVDSSGSFTTFGGTILRRRIPIERPIGTEVRQKPGPLQTIFELPPDEVVVSSYSCALERSFLYHGRMFVSKWHICFHSNVFSKQLKVQIPYSQIEEIKRSQHAFINPAITLILRAGSGGDGVPPLASNDGRAKYKFASFWNRNHVQRALLKAAKNYQTMQEAAKKEKKQSLLRTQSSTFNLNNLNNINNVNNANKDLTEPFVITKAEEENLPKVESKVLQPFLQDDALVELMKVDLPGTADDVWRLCLSGSKFTEDFRAVRKDTELKIEAWVPAEEYGGEVRTITFRALCTNPMCPPDTAMTEYQHASLFEGKNSLLFETVQQCHDVPFGSYFEVHVKWMFETVSANSCSVVVRVGAHFKKWCMMQSKIKAGTVKEYKGDAELIASTIRKFLLDEAKKKKEENGKVVTLLDTEAKGNSDTATVVPPQVD